MNEKANKKNEGIFVFFFWIFFRFARCLLRRNSPEQAFGLKNTSDIDCVRCLGFTSHLTLFLKIEWWTGFSYQISISFPPCCASLSFRSNRTRSLFSFDFILSHSFVAVSNWLIAYLIRCWYSCCKRRVKIKLGSQQNQYECARHVCVCECASVCGWALPDIPRVPNTRYDDMSNDHEHWTGRPTKNIWPAIRGTHSTQTVFERLVPVPEDRRSRITKWIVGNREYYKCIYVWNVKFMYLYMC